MYFFVFLFGNENSREFILVLRHQDRKKHKRRYTFQQGFERKIEVKTYFLKRKKS